MSLQWHGDGATSSKLVSVPTKGGNETRLKRPLTFFPYKHFQCRRCCKNEIVALKEKMGAATSSNVAEASSNVSTTIKQSTVVNAAQAAEQAQSVQIYKCFIKLKGDFNTKFSAEIGLRNNQIATVNSQATLTNTVAQSVLQQAMSKIGSMGVGYASAQNNVSMFCNITNKVLNEVSAITNQWGKSSQTWSCDQSTIIARNINIDFSSAIDFYNSQILKNTQIANVTNDIKQTVKQTASATVEGLAGFLIAIAVVIAAMGYSVSKGLGPIAPLITFVIVATIVALSVLNKWPPFFDEPLTCPAHIGESVFPQTCGKCINFATTTVRIDNPPVRYIYPLTEDYTASPDIGPGVCLTKLIIATGRIGANNNAGYNMAVWKKLDTCIEQIKKDLKTVDVSASKTLDTLINTTKYDIPNMLVNPVGGSTYVSIPEQFLQSDQSDDGMCTPGRVEYEHNGKQLPTPPTCPPNIGPYTWEDTTTDRSRGLANFNETNINTWIQNCFELDPKIGPAYVRFVLIRMLNMMMPSGASVPLNVHQLDEELVTYIDHDNGHDVKYAVALHAKDKVDHFEIDGEINLSAGAVGGGSFTAVTGICDNRAYKLHQFARRWGLIGIGAMCAGYGGFMVFRHVRHKGNKTSTTLQKGSK